MSLTCRVQYLNDIDPFSYTTNFPDPARPPQHTFSVTLPLINQLAAVHRLLKSPHRVSTGQGCRHNKPKIDEILVSKGKKNYTKP
jgi:hypothetical protein